MLSAKGINSGLLVKLRKLMIEEGKEHPNLGTSGVPRHHT